MTDTQPATAEQQLAQHTAGHREPVADCQWCPVPDDTARRREWAAAVRWFATRTFTEANARNWHAIADMIEAGDLTPWADQPEPAAPPAEQPHTAPAAADPHPGTVELEDTPCDDPECRCCYPMGVNPAAVSPAAGRVLEAARRWRAGLDAVGDTFNPHLHVEALAAAVDAADGDQPAERAFRARESDITGHGSGVSAGQPAGLRARPEPDSGPGDRDRLERLGREYEGMHRQKMAWEREAHRLRIELARAEADRDVSDRVRADEQRDRDQHSAVLGEVLGTFHEKGHPGYPALRSGWVKVTDYERWQAVRAPSIERPWWQQVAEANEQRDAARAELAEMTDQAKRLTNAQDQLRADLHETTTKLSEYVGAADDLRAELATARRDAEQWERVAGDMEARERHAAADALANSAARIRRIWTGSVDPEQCARYFDALASTTRAGSRPVPGSPQPAPAGGEEADQ